MVAYKFIYIESVLYLFRSGIVVDKVIEFDIIKDVNLAEDIKLLDVFGVVCIL